MTTSHQRVLARCASRQRVEVELVPEPGNPYHSWAVAFHIDGQRVGYLEGSAANIMQDYVVGHNRRGRAVYCPGVVSLDGKGIYRLHVYVPSRESYSAFTQASGIFEERDRVITAIAPTKLMRILTSDVSGLSKTTIRLLRSLKEYAPSMNWGSQRRGDVPSAVRHALGSLISEHQAAERRAEQGQLREQRQQESLTKVHDAAMAAADRHLRECRNPGAPEAASYITRCMIALALKEDRRTRAEVAQLMETSVEEVALLIKDARFFKNPASYPGRLRRTLAATSPSIIRLDPSAGAARFRVSVDELRILHRDAALLPSTPAP